MRRLVLAVCLCLLPLTAGAASPSLDPKQAPAGVYQIETRHTQVLFAISHLGLTDFHGRFEKITGSLTFVPGAPEKSSVTVKIDASSANVPNAELTTELISAHVFDAAQFPTMTFTSTSVARTGPASGRMTGDLTIHGVTRPVMFDVVFNGGMPGAMGGGYDLGFHATATIRRSEFGLDKMMWSSFVGDEVKLTIEALFVQQRS